MSLLNQFLAEEGTPHVRRLLEEAIANASAARPHFEFNRFELTLERDTGLVVIEDVLDATEAGAQQVSIAEFSKALRGHKADSRPLITVPLETQVLGVIALCRGLLPQEQLDDMDQLVRAGEPGVALENLSTQLHEYDVAVEQGTIKEIETLGSAMGLDSKYWSRLRSE